MEQNLKVQFSPLISLFCIFNLWLKGYEDLGCTTSTEEKKENSVMWNILEWKKRSERSGKPLQPFCPFLHFSHALSKSSPQDKVNKVVVRSACFYWHGKEKKDVKRKQNEPPFPPEVGQEPWPPSLGLKHQLEVELGVADKVSSIPLFAGSETPLPDNGWISSLLWDKNGWPFPPEFPSWGPGKRA